MPTTAEACPVHVLCSNDSYASKQVKRSSFSAWKCLRPSSAAFTAASPAGGSPRQGDQRHRRALQPCGLGSARVDLAALDGGEHHAEAVGHLATRLEPLRRRQARELPASSARNWSRSVIARAFIGSGDLTSVWNVWVLARRVDDTAALCPGILGASPARACRLLCMGCAPTCGWVSVFGSLGGVGAAGPRRWRLWRSWRFVWLVW